MTTTLADGEVVPTEIADGPRQPDTSDDYIVSKTIYNDSSSGGEIVDSIDNANVTTETQTDLAGRTIITIQNYVAAGLNSPLTAADSDTDVQGKLKETDTAEDIVTKYDYDSAGRLATVISYNAKGDDNDPNHNNVDPQTTEYLYGSTVNASWQTAVVQAGSTDTTVRDANGDWSITAGADHTSTTYDWLGRTTSTTDQRGVVHTYTYDSAGRLSADTVTDFGRTDQNVSQTVNEIDTSYDDLGRVHQTTSRGLVDNVETVLNQVQYAYDAWGNEIREWQALTGAVDTAATPSVQYVCADGAGNTGVAQYVRLTDVIYPNGRDVEYGYGTTGSVDDLLSRVKTIGGSDGTYATYGYLGAGTVVSEYSDLGAGTFDGQSYSDLQLGLDYSANNLGGFDRFGRAADQVWAMYSQSGGMLTKLATVDEYQYQYNAAGDRTARINAVDAAMSELYGYNALDELTAMERGTIGEDGQIADPGYSQSWTLDALGNMSSVDDNGTTTGRTTDAANEITGMTTDGTTTTPTYDAAGNLTSDGTNSYQYDAWDRLVEVDDGSTILAKYSYDAANRRITELTNFDANAVPGTVTYYYFDGQNAIEVRTGAVTGGVIPAPTSLPVEYQYVYDGQGDKTPILRDSSFDANGNATTAGRIFYTADANTNVTAVVDYNATTQTWSVSERYVYAAYGAVTVYNADWSSGLGTSLSASRVGNNVGFASMYFDTATGNYNDEARWYTTVTSTFIATDPIESTPNLYAYCGNGPTDATDASGLGGRFKKRSSQNLPAVPAVPSIPQVPTSEEFKSLQDDLIALLGAHPADKDREEACRIARAITYTWNNGHKTPSLPEQVKGYWCYEWAYAFKASVKGEKPTKFEAIVRQTRDPKSEKDVSAVVDGKVQTYTTFDVHVWTEIFCNSTKESVYIDDGAMDGQCVHKTIPQNTKYTKVEICTRNPTDGTPPTSYNSQGKENSGE